MTKSVFMSLAVVLVILAFGCRKPPAALVARALASTNVVCQPYHQEPITLSKRGDETIKRIVKLFEDASRVEVRTDKTLLPAPEGWFLLGDVHFFFIGSLLCLQDKEKGIYYVVQDPVLGKMAELHLRIEGRIRPGDLSREQWQEVVAALENGNDAERGGAANGSQPIRSQTTSTSPAAGSRR
jgi:hypothetical protein